MAANWRTRIGSLLGPTSEERGLDRGMQLDEGGHGAEPSSERTPATRGIAPVQAQGSEKRRPWRDADEPVLIVDDDRDWCLECSFSLQQLGYEPLVANGTSDALAIFMENDVSIAIVDYNLPEGDGLSLIHALKSAADEQGRSLSFIMATGYATKDVAIGAMRASVADFLEKPITLAQLRASLQRIKGLRPSAPARDALLDKISGLSVELQRLAHLMDAPEAPADARVHEAHDLADEEAGPGDLTAYIRDQLRRETKRRAIAGGELFGDPTWAMLLDLLLAKIEGRRIAVSSACIASGAPMSTALRLVRRLVGEEVLCRVPDEHDRRRHFLAINPKFEQPLVDYIADQMRQG
jgi:DNA-binding response OmpR family regulator